MLFKSQVKLELYADVHRAKKGMSPKFWGKWQALYAKIMSTE